ncbi:uncharacterized protein E0L32_007799 [Thyridium curvatum]|uniref:Ribosomal protein L10 n=1 Tax=Thyridium curvatum TaxID=1093900 RepID=A0A507B3X7_9PEZI|nr:uncharacterized protein E0L32_007799 [Thyridium curvatum]TPX11588.1 hypothetical protein E0L32_007799 [Thyridium curvatum]
MSTVSAPRPRGATPRTQSETCLRLQSRSYASLSIPGLALPADYVPPTQPPSARRPEVRKAQLLRTYTSLLRSTPLILMFQHNNLTATEWAAIRRELNLALANVPVPGATTPAADGSDAPLDITSKIQLQVVRTRIFDVALKVVEFFDPAAVQAEAGAKGVYNHDLSRAAFAAMKGASADPSKIPESSTYGELAPLMVGPLALLTLPAVSPAHLAAALSILAPSPPAFPAPTRKKNPGYYDATVQNGLQKLLLVGGRIEGKVFDTDGVRWVGGIEGGLDGLRAQLVAMLQQAGVGLTTVLEGAGKSLYVTMESRKEMLEKDEKGPEAGAEAEAEKKE